jgi:ribosomal protein S18 acetylase RimI-like enzyme
MNTVEIILLQRGDEQILAHVAPDVFDDPIDLRATTTFLDDPRHKLVVARDSHLIVGFVSGVVYVHPDKRHPELWINEVSVAASHRRSGVGRQLLNYILDVGQRAGCSEAWVLADESNRDARQFYRSIGGNEAREPAVMFSFRLKPDNNAPR